MNTLYFHIRPALIRNYVVYLLATVDVSETTSDIWIDINVIPNQEKRAAIRIMSKLRLL
jgi:hypothetical protein